MNITFTIMAHGLTKAGQIEDFLREHKIPYEAKEAKGVSAPKRTRVVLNKAQVMSVAHTIDREPDWDDKEVAKHSGVGRNTVNRIRRGLHPLSPGYVKPNEIGPANQLGMN